MTGIEKTKMQFRDLHAQYEVLKPEIDAGIQAVINSSNFILGKPVVELEEKLAVYVGRKHCIGVANGTDALTLSLMAMDVGAGDAVFTSDFTYFASAGSASMIKATPIFVDVDLSTFNLAPDSLEKQIKRVLAEGKLNPKVIVPVDLFGLPADYDSITPIAEKYGLKILEDGAQGFGGRICGKKACSFGDISATSFFPAKPLGCYGDGGAIFTDDDEVDARLRSLRAQGKSPYDKYDNLEIGMNSRLDTIQAAVLLTKFKAFVEYELEAVNREAEKYTNIFSGRVRTPVIPEGFYSSWAQYTIILESQEQRAELQAKLKEKGIPTMIYYPRGLHQQQAYRWMNLGDEAYPNTSLLTQCVLSLPMHPYMKDEEQNYIIEALLEAL